MPSTLIDRVNQLRSKISANWLGTARELGPISDWLRRDARDPVLAELASRVLGHDFTSDTLFRLSVAPGSETAVGFFKVPYAKEAWLEAFAFQDLPADPEIAARAPASVARPVVLGAHTLGIAKDRFVAVFPENFIGHQASPNDPAFYFVNKFLTRTWAVTLPHVRSVWHSGSFAALRNADAKSLTQACAVWVHLHEGFHKQSPLPLPEGLSAKNSLNASAFEEMRVDVTALSFLQTHFPDLPVARLTFELILAERLFGYALEYDPATDLDGRTSAALMQEARSKGVVQSCLSNGTMRIVPDRLRSWIDDLANRCAQADVAASRAPKGAQKPLLEQFVKTMLAEAA